jgi:UDP-glucose 4,6-dehydratase
MEIMKNFLVTGACGFILSNFVNYMSKKYPKSLFIVLDKMDYISSIENLDKNKNIEIIVGDIRNKELIDYILNKFNINIIVHGAASSHVDNSFFNSISFTENNVLGTHVLLECARKYYDSSKNFELFLHISTDEVYGEIKDNIARCEKGLIQPTNPYACSKAAAEFLVNSYNISYKLPVIITRGNNVYGINQYPEKIIPKFICQLLNNKKITIHGKGESKRDFMHVNDVVTAFETVIFNGKLGEIYNVGSSHKNEYNVMEIAKILIFIIKKDTNMNDYIEYVDDRKFNDCRYYINSDKLKNLGWEEKNIDFLENIDFLIEWYKNNKNRFGF